MLSGVFVRLRNIETWLRRRRVNLSKRLASSRRGRKILLDFLPANIKEVTVDCGDHRLTVVPHEMIGRHVVASGHYTREAVGYVLSELDRRGLMPSQGGSVLEIGANIGTHTVYLALTGRVTSILAVEPDRRNISLLERNIRDNGFADLVRIAACAAGAEEGTLTLHRIAGNYGSSGFMHHSGTGDSLPVPVKPVDTILRESGMDQADISLVWMDIEGFEPQAMQSMQELLIRQVPIYLEFSPGFYGLEGTRNFVNFLERFYSRCMLVCKEGIRSAAVRDLVMQTRQCDVLLLPEDR